tara:strand:+ start:57235 stop:57645 length:411 start_codon:yes stop_codon:yes gene_type:complete
VSIKKKNLIELPLYEDNRGSLVVIEGEDIIPFSIKRVFIVNANVGEIRGEHAHKKCNQFMVCASGKIEVICSDGVTDIKYLLDSPSHGLHVPPGIWAKEQYLTNDAVLTVLCDRHYEKDDYINDYEEFLKFQRGNK